MQGLKDIKGLVEVTDYSLWWLLAIIFIVFIMTAFALYLYKNRRIRKKRASPREVALSNLKNIDFSDTKNTVYTFIQDGKQFLTPENETVFKNLEKDLEKYKYKKEVPIMDEALKDEIKRFIKEIK